MFSTTRKRLLLAVSLALASFTVAATPALAEDKVCSPQGGEPFKTTFANRTSGPVTFHWMGFDCAEGAGTVVESMSTSSVTIGAGHIFRVRDADGNLIATMVADPRENFIVEPAGETPSAPAAPETTAAAEEKFCSVGSGAYAPFVIRNKTNSDIIIQKVDKDCVNGPEVNFRKGSTRHIERVIVGDAFLFRYYNSQGEEVVRKIRAEANNDIIFED